jgi:hypothetical protein
MSLLRQRKAPQFNTTSVPYELWQDAEKKAQFQAANPKQFTGKYGRYADNKFCGLNCGYMWAIRNAPAPIER